MTSILASSWHLTYRMAYDHSTCLRRNNYYINLYVHCNFYICGKSYFLYRLHAVSYYRVWLCLRMIFSFPYFYPLYLRWTWSLILWDIRHPHFQHTHLLREVPSVGYICFYIPWLLHGTSQIVLLVKLWWRNIQACALCCSMQLIYFWCQPGPSQINNVYLHAYSSLYTIYYHSYPFLSHSGCLGI